MRLRLALPALLLLLPACIVEAPTSEKSGVSSSRAQGKGAPAPVKSGALLGDAAELMGATFLPASVTPGDSTQVVLVFRALKPPPEDWQVFVHVEDADGRQERMNADHPLRRPMSSWTPGEVVQDEFVITLPATWRTRAVNIYVGLWLPRTEERMKVRNPQTVRTDGSDRVLLVQLPVTG
jgi:hypothetical protein